MLGTTVTLPVLIGLAYYRRAGTSLTQYFLSGRELPWWLAGTSMVATTFAADTPLAVTGMVALNGIAGNWLWWNAGLGSMLTVFFFARLWRRAGILTDVEFAELRYAGRPAAFLRGFRALFLGLPVNCLVIGWVNLAMAKILAVTLGWSRLTAVLVGLAASALYASLSGLRGVVVSDFVQFGLAIAGTVALAFFALGVPEVGGLDGLRAALPDSTFRLAPVIGTADAGDVQLLALPIAAFVAYLGGSVVGELVSGTGAGRWRLCRATDDVGPGRTPLAPGDTLVHARALLRPAVALDHRGARLARALSRSDRSRIGVRAGDARSPAPGVAGALGRRVFRGVHVDSVHPAQLGDVLSGQRRLRPVPATAGPGPGARACLTHGDRGRDARERSRDVLARERAAGLGAGPGVRRRSWAGADSALVLVARKYVLRDRRDGGGGRRVPRAEALHRDCVSHHPALPGAVDHMLLADRHVPDAPGTGGPAGRLLPPGPTGGSGMGTGRNAVSALGRTRDSDGPPSPGWPDVFCSTASCSVSVPGCSERLDRRSGGSFWPAAPVFGSIANGCADYRPPGRGPPPVGDGTFGPGPPGARDPGPPAPGDAPPPGRPPGPPCPGLSSKG